MSLRARQRGISIVLIMVALVALLAVGGLALDVSHALADKSRLQATVDAAALSAAKVLDTTGSTTQASAAASAVFTLNANQQSELKAANITPTVQFSNTLVPFSAGTVPAYYVKVTASGFSISATLARTVGINNLTMASSAIAGPSPTIDNGCNLAPLLVCGTAPTAGNPLYGYSQGQVVALKLSAGGASSPGNYNLLALGGNGANVVRQNLAGDYNSCANLNSTVTTQPGVAAGPTAQGLNTRFGQYQGGGMNSTSYPPDVITNQPSGTSRLSCSSSSCATIVTGPGGGTVITNASQYGAWSYDGMYLPDLQTGTLNNPPPSGVVDRRVLAAPVGDCSTMTGGRTTVNVLGFACLFLLQDVDTSGTGGQIFGEMLPKCQIDGTPGVGPNTGPGPYIIQLYHVAGSTES